LGRSWAETVARFVGRRNAAQRATSHQGAVAGAAHAVAGRHDRSDLADSAHKSRPLAADVQASLTKLLTTRLRLISGTVAHSITLALATLNIVLTAAPLTAALGIYARERFAQGLLTAAACAVVLLGGYWLWQRVLSA